MTEGVTTVGFAEYRDKRRAKEYNDPASEIQTFSDEGLMARTVGVLAEAQDSVEEAPDMEVLRAVLEEVRIRIERMAHRHEQHDYQRAMALEIQFETDAL